MTKEEVLKIMHGHSTIPSAMLSGVDYMSGGNSIEARVTELEVENIRLQKLVAELLLKNQQLRRTED